MTTLRRRFLAHSNLGVVTGALSLAESSPILPMRAESGSVLRRSPPPTRPADASVKGNAEHN
ncbi:hypothetical protein ACL02O_08570 [Micromonospora sp. MS34]|uniref:hypothetical protein n=1 Tax=Micromonospora sp. MS34 TaxID=3385971 RepID=UPI0039A2F7C1